MYQILQKFDIHWHDGGPSITMMYHLRRVSDLLCNWKSCLLCYMKDVVLHCSIFFKWNKLVRVRVRVRQSGVGEKLSWCIRHLSDGLYILLGHYHEKIWRYQSVKQDWKFHFQNHIQISQGPMSEQYMHWIVWDKDDAGGSLFYNHNSLKIVPWSLLKC